MGSLLFAQYDHFNSKLCRTWRREKSSAQQEEFSDSQTGRAQARSLRSDADGVAASSSGSRAELTLWAPKGKMYF